MNELYKSKLTTAKEAAAIVKSGDWVDYGWTTTTPVAFDKAMAERLPEETIQEDQNLLMYYDISLSRV